MRENMLLYILLHHKLIHVEVVQVLQLNFV